MRNYTLLALKSFLLSATLAHGHEFWIAPEKYQVEIGEGVAADFVNGQEFRGATLAWFDNRVDRAEAFLGADSEPMNGRIGDIPALTSTANKNGLLVLITETKPATVNYRNAEKFANFVTHKDLGVKAEDQTYPFKEAYSRHAKALVQVGSGEGQDRLTGMATEFVALENPYTGDMSDGIDVQLFYLGAPRINAQIEVFQMDPEGNVEITLMRSDSEGKATIPVRQGHRYLVDSVVIRVPSQATLDRVSTTNSVQWETLWAALTFEVPS